jgi:glycosyltransferase involved in cell wall biosynthesis
MTATPVIDVVVPTFNRVGLVERALEPLGAQRYPPERYRIIVVDDGSTDDTWARLQRWATDHPNVMLHRRAHAGSYAARNVGWRAGTGEVIAFTDDDCVASPDWLGATARALAAHPAAVAVQGRTLTLRHLVTPMTHQVVVHRPNRLYQTCNIAYRRDVVRAVGGFDGAMRHFADTKLAAAASGRGPIVFSPEMIVVHPPRPRAFFTREEWSQWLRDERRLYRSHPDFYRKARGPTPLVGVTLHWLIGSTVKHAARHLPWLLRDPALYLKSLGLLARERRGLVAELWQAQRRGPGVDDD